jgi:putative phage-type endonuclease
MEYQIEQEEPSKKIIQFTSILPTNIHKHNPSSTTLLTTPSDDDELSDTSSVTPVYDQLNEDEVLEVETTILDWLNDYLETHVAEMSNPQFHEQMVDYVTLLLYEDWIHMELCVEANYDDIHFWVSQMSEIVHLQSSIPPRTLQNEELDIHISPKPFDNIKKQLDYLQSIPQPKQKTDAWYAFRYNVLTASNVWKVFSSPAQYNSLIYEKCKPYKTEDNVDIMGWKHPTSTNAMHWGVRYEPVSVALYEYLNHTRVGEFGCIVHPALPHLAASPDGINVDETHRLYGRMIEVKNIVNREITGVPLEHYWIQMQVQMEVCDLDECDFIETRFKEFETEIDFYAWTQSQKGVILYFLPKPRFGEMQSDGKYVYMPIDWPKDMMSVETWIQRQKLERPESVCIHTTYWYLDQYSCVFVPRNRAWFASVSQKIQDCWKTIERERIDGYQHREPAKKTPKVLEIQVTSDISNETHFIENMPATNIQVVIKQEHT